MYTAEFWTTIGQIINGEHQQHDHWVVLNASGEVVAGGGETFCKQYAKRLNSGEVEESEIERARR